MKAITRIMVSAAVALTFIPALKAEQVSVTLTEAGTLEKALADDDLLEITSLKVSGPMNGTDLRTLRKMLGRTELWKETMGQLTDLDLTDAIMVAGDEPYAAAMGTEASGDPVWMYAREGALPENLFSFTKLSSIKLPTSINGIYSSFNKAYNLSGTIDIPEGVTFLGEYAFAESGIEQINLPSTLADGPDKHSYNKSALGAYAFAGCGSLKAITFPAGVTLLKTCAFMNCTSLTEIRIPTTLAEIGSNAFNGCTGIKDFWVDSPKPPKAGWEAFKYMNFDDCVLHVQAGSELLFADADEWSEFESIRGIGASPVKASLTSQQPDFSGVEVYVDGKKLAIPDAKDSFSTDIYIGSRIKVYELDTHRIIDFYATGAKTSRKEDGAYAAVIKEDGASVSIDFEEVIISVETMSSYIGGELCGTLKMRYNGEEVSFADMKVGETVEFIPVAQPGYTFDYITRVYDGSDDSDSYSGSYVATKLDVDQTVIFKAIFHDTAATESVAADAADLKLEGTTLRSSSAIRIYNVSGRLILTAAAGEFDTARLPAATYIAISGLRALKFQTARNL